VIVLLKKPSAAGRRLNNESVSEAGYDATQYVVSVPGVGPLNEWTCPRASAGSCSVAVFSQITGILSIRFAYAERGDDTQRIEIYQNMIKPV
jgi:hypothetical protein